MKSKNKWLVIVAVTLISLLFIMLMIKKLNHFIDYSEHKRFKSAYKKIVIGQDVNQVIASLNITPLYDLNLDEDASDHLSHCGLLSLPPLNSDLNIRVAALPWRGIPSRFIFVFYSSSSSNILNKAYCIP